MKRTLSTYVIRTCAVVLWAVLFLGFLYSSEIIRLPSQEKTLNILAWGDVFDPAYLRNFEQEMGIKIRMSYYSSNEELLVKLRATQGKGYDLVVPSDYAVKRLSEEELLQPLDHTKLSFLQALNPLLLNLSYDPNNRYAIPYAWEIFGIGIDTEKIDKEYANELGWDLIFKPVTGEHTLCMVNDPMEAFIFAAHYLFGRVDWVNHEQRSLIGRLLHQQKKRVEAYSSFRADYFLATKNCSLVITSSSYIWRSINQYPYIDFIIPHQGTFITIENISIPKATRKIELIYKFIDFLYKPATIQHHVNVFAYLPARIDMLREISMSDKQRELAVSSADGFKNYSLIYPIMTEQQKHDLWVRLKS